MSDEITMTGRYAYRRDPTTQVRVRWVDGLDRTFPVCSETEKGTVIRHASDGQYIRDRNEHDFDLIPLAPAREWWINTYPGHADQLHETKARADEAKLPGVGETVHVREVFDD